MRKFIAAMSLIFSFNVQADLLDNALNYVKESEYSVFYAYKSVHLVTEDYTNSTHNMIGIRINSFVAGRFDNSYDRDTFFVGLYGDLEYDYFEVFGVVGAMKGYTKCYGEDPNEDAKWCAMVAVGASYTGFGEHFKPTLFQLGDASALGVKSDF